MRGLGSDNHSGVHPEIMQQLLVANHDHMPSYGTDTVSAQLKVRCKELFGPSCEVYPVFNGTAANVLWTKFAPVADAPSDAPA